MITLKSRETLIVLIQQAMAKCDKPTYSKICRLLVETTSKGLNTAPKSVILEICKMLEGILRDDRSFLVVSKKQNEGRYRFERVFGKMDYVIDYLNYHIRELYSQKIKVKKEIQDTYENSIKALNKAKEILLEVQEINVGG